MERATTAHEPFTREQLCPLDYRAGTIDGCADAECLFWEPGLATGSGVCGLKQLELVDRPMLAAWLRRNP